MYSLFWNVISTIYTLLVLELLLLRRLEPLFYMENDLLNRMTYGPPFRSTNGVYRMLFSLTNSMARCIGNNSTIKPICHIMIHHCMSIQEPTRGTKQKFISHSTK